MMIDLICKNNSNELCDTSKDQIGMQSYLILSPASRKTEIFFDVIDISFYYGSDFICIIPFFGSANGSRVGTQVSFGIDIDHAAASRWSTGIIAETFPAAFARGFVTDPFHFWTDELESRDAAPQIGFGTFRSHGEGRVMGTAGDTVCVNDIIPIFQTRSCIERNISFGEMSINAEGIAGEKLFIKCCGIESRIPKEGLGIEQGCFAKKSLSVGIRSLESWTHLSSSGESDFFSTMISGWAFKKSLL